MSMTQEERRNYVGGLFDLVNWLDQNPNFDLYSSGIEIFKVASTKKEFVEQVKVLGSAIKEGDKNSHYLRVTKKFGPHSVEVCIAKNQSCERVQVGMITVKKPDPNVTVPMIEVQEPQYEWKCPDSLLKEVE